MAWTHYQKLLATIMVITGSFNTLSVKFADMQASKGENGEIKLFKHPYVETTFMFFGELLCLLAFKIAWYYYNRLGDGSVDTNSLTKGSRNFNPLILCIPAICDMIATSIMYVGLNMTYPSSFQMLRGSVIVFTGFLSMTFLDRKLCNREWTGIVFVILGLTLVGYADFLLNKNSQNSNSVITGDLLIITAQIITAIQMVVEEKYVMGKDIPPLQAVGWEGLFGLFGMFLIMIPFNYIHVPPPFADNSQGTIEAPIDALIQIKNNSNLLIAITGIVLSIAFFNFAGISITKELNATTRMILDSVRTIVIWIFSLSVGWQQFHYLQPIGFLILFLGMCCYNNVFVLQTIRKIQYRLGRHSTPENLVNSSMDSS